MTKKELKKLLRVYPIIYKDICEKKTQTIIEVYGRKKLLKIPPWIYLLDKIFQKIKEKEDDYVVTEIIDKSYKKGLKDRELLFSLPVTESGYYRLKRRLEEQIYNLYIVLGYVTEEDILKNKLFE